MLLGNGFATLGAVPSTYLGGAVGVAYPGNLRTLSGRGERLAQASAFGKLASQPDGANHPVAWLMARRAGRISARAVGPTLTPTAAGLRGLPGTGAAQVALTWAAPVIHPLDDTPPIRTASAGLTLLTNTPAGQLIVSGAGAGSFNLGALATLLATLTGSGAAELALTLSAQLSAEASLAAAATLRLTLPAAVIYPLDDAPPARAAGSTLSLSGALTPYAVGHLAGSTVDAAGLTADAIAAAVWAAVAAGNNAENTMGEKLNAAGTAGDPWTGVIEGALTAKEVLRILLATVAGQASGGGTGTIAFRDQADTKDRLVATVDSRGNRAAVVVDGS